MAMGSINAHSPPHTSSKQPIIIISKHQWLPCVELDVHITRHANCETKRQNSAAIESQSLGWQLYVTSHFQGLWKVSVHVRFSNWTMCLLSHRLMKLTQADVRMHLSSLCEVTQTSSEMFPHKQPQKSELLWNTNRKEKKHMLMEKFSFFHRYVFILRDDASWLTVSFCVFVCCVLQEEHKVWIKLHFPVSHI